MVIEHEDDRGTLTVVMDTLNIETTCQRLEFKKNILSLQIRLLTLSVLEPNVEGLCKQF
ncbi:hypothetical protein DPMN_094486 [Dreissena polymorpha]|uniref:Uncharacterized protein n=1 Tax=Dreissena polymorpha TaxID=45954 RepID=A0A9D4L7I3_DREPO|nr:hypothetical protein DPMN_094486 [Dreissena polymorpha]